MCLDFGTPKNNKFLPFGTNGKFIILGVPILKHIRVSQVIESWFNIKPHTGHTLSGKGNQAESQKAKC